MKWLKGILIGLVVLLVVIIAAGGALIGFNHTGHDPQQMASQDKNQSGVQNGLPADSSQSGSTTDPAHQSQSGNSQQNNSHGNQANINPQQPQVAVVVPDSSVAPEEYLKRIEESAQLIKEATGLIANDAYIGVNPTPGDLNNQNATSQQPQNASGMAQMHQGIYKMAQALTIMDQTIKEMNREIKNAREKGISYYEVLPKTQYIPNNLYPYWNSPQQYQQPNYAPYYYQQPPFNPNAQMHPNQQNSQQQNPQPHNAQPSDQGHGATAAGHAAPTGLSNVFNLQSLVLIIYGILFMSFIAAIIGIGGYISSLFKSSQAKQQSGENVV